ncbi:proton-conducting transporter membrane subunit [Tepidibacillus sp. HK-1]|uniref:proton-conducting transporter transmembrane domain-containing protein n=1 Tax=Tepidibacillus sp. HK-1 TaxID=1883407 RepID=UPI0008531327|nr:proton-conducting transporter membrane subunit [Tepidibacillus sp. HK-1]GBF10332.1 hydrogenase-4 component B [Tepidibacillus sp. HK-1]
MSLSMFGEDLLLLAFTFLFLGSVGVIFWSKKQQFARWITLFTGGLGSLFALLSSLWVLTTQRSIYIEGWNITPNLNMLIRMDQLSAIFVLVISLISFVSFIYGFGYTQKFIGKKRLDFMGALANSFVLMMIAVVTADHFITFLIAWESMSILSYLLVVTEYEYTPVQRAGYVYLVMTHIGTFFIILGFFYLYRWTGTQQISLLYEQAKQISDFYKNLLFFLFIIGFGTKAGIFPLHVWLPRAHPIAPSHISALMSGIMIKTALYGILRFLIQDFSFGETWWAWVIIILGILSAIYGVLFGVVEKDIKRYLAYSSSENMGLMWMILGVSMLLIQQQEWVWGIFAFTALLFHLLNHAVFKSLLFLGAGSIDYSIHTKNMNHMGGLIHRMPWTSIMVLIGVMGMAAIPPFNGFISEWMMLKSFIYLMSNSQTLYALVGLVLLAVLGMVGALTVAGVVNLFGLSFLGRPRSSHANEAQEVPLSMRWAMGILASLILILGLGSKWIGQWLFLHAQSLIFNGSIIRSKLPVLTLKDTAHSFTIQPLSLGVLLLIGLLLGYGLIHFFFHRPTVRISPTWGCGIQLDEKMEYTASSFTHPFLHIFKKVIPSSQMVQQGREGYFPHHVHYKLLVKQMLDVMIYRPILQGLLWLASKIKKIQNGNIQTYLTFMFVTLILFLLFVK